MADLSAGCRASQLNEATAIGRYSPWLEACTSEMPHDR